MNHKSLRHDKLFDRESNRTVLLPIDHGVTMGPCKGLRDLDIVSNMAKENGVKGIIAHKGIINSIVKNSDNTSGIEYILHLSASMNFQELPEYKQTISSVEHALRIGASAVSVHLNLGVDKDYEMLKEFGKVSDEAYKWNMPVIAMINLFNEYGKTIVDKRVIHSVRAVGELGADIVKVGYCEDEKIMREVFNAFEVPVLVAGGNKKANPLTVLNSISKSLQYGSSGVCIGRNIFESENPMAICKTISEMVYKNLNIEEAINLYSKLIEREYKGGNLVGESC